MSSDVTYRPQSKFSIVANDAGDIDQLDLRPDHYEAYRIDQQVRPSNALLDFWFSTGDQRAIAYNHLYDIAFNPSQGLELTFSEHIATIHGRRLAELYRHLKRHKVVWIWEALSQEARDAEAGTPVVTKIAIKPRFPDQT